jgi:hypothetical protein
MHAHRQERKINRPAQLMTGTTRDKIASLVAPAATGCSAVDQQRDDGASHYEEMI